MQDLPGNYQNILSHNVLILKLKEYQKLVVQHILLTVMPYSLKEHLKLDLLSRHNPTKKIFKVSLGIQSN